jgi:hypothetical protein
MSTRCLPPMWCPTRLNETVTRCVNVLDMSMYSRWLDCCLVDIYTLVDALLFMGLVDVFNDRRKVCRCLVDVWDGRVKGVRIAVEHLCGDIWCLWLLMLAEVSNVGDDSYHGAHALVKRYGAALA